MSVSAVGHVGKLVILWGFCALWLWTLTSEFWVGSRGPELEFALAWFVYMLFCTAVTWRWLGGREGK